MKKKPKAPPMAVCYELGYGHIKTSLGMDASGALTDVILMPMTEPRPIGSDIWGGTPSRRDRPVMLRFADPKAIDVLIYQLASLRLKWGTIPHGEVARNG